MENGRKSSQKVGLRASKRRVCGRLGRGIVEEGEAGVGGLAGRNSVGMVATEEMMATYSVMFGMSSGLEHRKGLISCPSAPPNGFASDAMAVAETRPCGENHRSE